jgi:hypothetical protein
MANSINVYLDRIAQGADLSALSWSPDDPQIAEELCDQVFMNLCQGYFTYLQADGKHPDFGPLYNSVMRLQPNPDDTYTRTWLDSDGIYRLHGERGSVRLLTLTLAGTSIGMTDIDKVEGQTAEYDLDEVISFEPDGRFSVIISAERPSGHSGNWLRLPPGTKSMITRQRCYDWGNEADARVAIERLDVSPLKPRVPLEALRERLAGLAAFGERHSRQWLIYQDQMRVKGIVNRVEHHGFTELGGVRVQVYWWGIYDLQPGEALILETEIPDKPRYWNVQLNDEIWNTLEYVWRQSSLNGHQAKIDADGKFRAVISPQDPAVPNWLDTVGRLKGTLVGRWYQCSTNPVPQIKKVRLSEVRDHLPAETPHVSPEQRDSDIRARASGAQLRRRW